MNKGWMRVREAATLLSVSESTVRRRIDQGQLRGRPGKSGRQEVFVAQRLRQAACAQGALETQVAEPDPQSESSTGFNDGEAALIQDTPASSSQAAAGERPEDLVKRYERMAGGSLLLAQKRADELNQAASAAYENLAHARHQLSQVRKVALAGWGASAVLMLLGLILSLGFGISSAKAQARAQASEHAADSANRQAQVLREELAESRHAALDPFTVQASVPTD